MYNYPKTGGFMANTPNTGFGTTSTTFGQPAASTNSIFPAMQPANLFQTPTSTFSAPGPSQSAFAPKPPAKSDANDPLRHVHRSQVPRRSHNGPPPMPKRHAHVEPRALFSSNAAPPAFDGRAPPVPPTLFSLTTKSEIMERRAGRMGQLTASGAETDLVRGFAVDVRVPLLDLSAGAAVEQMEVVESVPFPEFICTNDLSLIFRPVKTVAQPLRRKVPHDGSYWMWRYAPPLKRRKPNNYYKDSQYPIFPSAFRARASVYPTCWGVNARFNSSPSLFSSSSAAFSPSSSISNSVGSFSPQSNAFCTSTPSPNLPVSLRAPKHAHPSVFLSGDNNAKRSFQTAMGSTPARTAVQRSPIFLSKSLNSSSGYSSSSNSSSFSFNQNASFSSNKAFGSTASPFRVSPVIQPIFSPQTNNQNFQNSQLFSNPLPQYPAVFSPPPAQAEINDVTMVDLSDRQPTFGRTNNNSRNQLFTTQQPSTSTNLFGQKQSGFGFGQQPAQPSTLFGQTAQPALAASSSLFQSAPQPSLFGGSGFGAQPAPQPQTGTVVKFAPVNGTDTMQKNGVATSISTKHHSITCMKEYETKSFEELRAEDYAVGRKGPQQAGAFGATFAPAPSLFGHTEAKPAFGQAAPAFGAPFGQQPAFGAAQPAAASIFKPSFGAPASTAAGGFGFTAAPPAASIFSAGQAKPFGGGGAGLFGAPAAQPPATFGGANVFGAAPGQGGLFQKPAQPAAGFAANQPVFSFNQSQTTQASNVFQLAKPNTSFGLQPQAGAVAPFGQAAQPAFGANNAFGKPAAQPFAYPNQSMFGNTLGGGTLGQPQQQASLFSSAAAKPTNFFGTNTGTSSLFPSVFQQPQQQTLQFNMGMTQQPQNTFPPDAATDSRNVSFLMSDVFSDGPHTYGLEPVLSKMNSTTNPAGLKAVLDASKSHEEADNVDRKLRVSTPKGRLSTSMSTVDFFDTNSALKASHKCLVIRKPAGSVRSFYNNYEADLAEQAARASGEEEAMAAAQSPPRERLGAELGRSPAEADFRRPIQRLQFESTRKDRPPADEHVTLGAGDGTTLFHAKSFGIAEDELPLPEADVSGGAEAPSAAGIVLTKAEYYTVPPLRSLDDYIDANGQCIVKGLTVGRKGYGNVFFLEPVNVTNLNLDEIISFRHREITVYPSEMPKPKIGEGLNVPAQVTLDKIYPLDSESKQYVTAVDEILRSQFVDKLIAITAKHDCKFVDYRPETGSWVFKVKHFSKYSFTDSDEEECSIDTNVQTTPKFRGYAKKAPEPKMKLILELDESGTSSSIDKLGLGGSTTTIDSSKHDGINVEDFAQDVDDIMADEMPSDSESDMTEFFVDCLKVDFDTSDNMVEKKLRQVKGHLVKNLESIASETMTQRAISEPALAIEQKPVEVVANPSVYTLCNLPKTFIADSGIEEKSYTEMSLYKNASFRVGWGPGLRFFTLDPKCRNRLVYLVDSCSIEVGEDPCHPTMVPNLDKVFEVILEESNVTFVPGEVPLFEIKDDLGYLTKLSALFVEHVTENELTGKFTYYSAVLRLCMALWGRNGDDSAYGRRQQLSLWLKEFTNELLSEMQHRGGRQTPFDELHRLLSFFKISEASALASKHQLHNLSLLIAQMSANERIKSWLRRQLDDFAWKETGAIGDDYKRLYLLLAGVPVDGAINTCADLDWLRGFGVHLWYVAPSAAPISAAFGMYKRAHAEGQYAAPPVPHYLRSRAPAQNNDLLYNVLALYVDATHQLAETLHPETHTPNAMDYRFSWLMLQVCLSLKVGLVRGAEVDHLHTTFAAQLEELGDWKWAVFVLLFLADKVVKRDLIMKLLHRHLAYDRETDTVENELVRVFKVPSDWIHEVKALKAKSEGKQYDSYQHFVHMRKWQDANDVLMEKILPDFFNSDQYELMSRFIGRLRPFAFSLGNWGKQTGIFDDFLDVEEMIQRSSDCNGQMVATKLNSVRRRATVFDPKNLKQKLCVAELLRKCDDFEKVIENRFRIVSRDYDMVLVE